MRAQALVLRSSVLATLAAGIALGQTPGPTVVRWQFGAANSDWLVRNGVEIVMVGQDGLTVKVALTVHHPRQVALVDVTNETGQRVEVVPSRMTFDLVAPEPRTLAYLDPDTLGASVRKISAWAYVFVAMAGMRTQRSHTTGMVGGEPVNLTTTTHDQAGEDRAIEAVQLAQARKAALASEIERGALRENTVLPGEHVGGAVFFATPSHYQKDYGTGKLEAVLRVPVGDYVFEFPFWWEGTLPTTKHQGPEEQVFQFPLWWKARR